MPGHHRSILTTTLVGVALALSFPGCSSRDAAPEPVTTRDSAGVTIVENPIGLREAADRWTLSATPSFAIGAADGPEEMQLYRVRGASRLSDGRIAVGNSGSSEVRIYSPDGNGMRVLGGSGEGPGEFSDASLVGVVGDSLVVLDRQLRRVSIMHPDSDFVRSFDPDQSLGAYFTAGWLMDGGTLVLQELPLDQSAVTDGYHRAPIPLRACNLIGAQIGDFGLIPGAERFVTTGEGPHGGIASVLREVPLGKAPQIAVAGASLYVGSQDSYEVRVHTSDGRLTRIIRLREALTPATEAARGAVIDQEVEGMADPNRERRLRTELEEMPIPEYLPAHGVVAADATGYLFVERYRLPGQGASSSFDVFDPAGRLTAHLELAHGVRVLQVGTDYLLGLRTDELGIEEVLLYDLMRS